MSCKKSCLWFIGLASFLSGTSGGSPPGTTPVGVARIDITPAEPVRMYGYGSRTTESEGIAGRLYAKALALGGDGGEGPAVLLTVDCGAVPADISSRVMRRLQKRAKIQAGRVVLLNTHTHAGPNVKGAKSLPPQERARLLRYSERLARALEKVALDALACRKPGRLAWTRGKVDFAANRRVLKDGVWTGFGADRNAPADHGLPILRVTDEEGALVAVLINYACHCTTLRANFKKIHGDWAGCAQKMIEAENQGAVALVSIGCGADSDPYPHGTVELAEQHGRAVADEVKRLLPGPFQAIDPVITARRSILKIPFEKPASLEELEKRAGSSWSLQGLLARLRRGEELPPLEYPITTWTFGDDLAMVFLTGEVVVDYALRLRRELDGRRLWINAYAHEVPCYIVSRRILKEGGYEARNSLSSRISFGEPKRVDPAMEDRIVEQVKELLPAGFRRHERRY